MIVWNAESLETLKSLVVAGLLPGEIAEKMGASRGAINSALTRNGLKTVVTHLDREAIRRLIADGYGAPQIARKTGLLAGQVVRIVEEERRFRRL